MTKATPAAAGLEDLLDLVHGGGIDMRPTLLRVLTDLYLQRPTHTPEDEGYYAELAVRLIDAVEVPERAALAARLAAVSSAPRAVLMRLARDVIEVAAPILRQSPCLTAADLDAVAACGGAHADAIAARPVAAKTAPAAVVAATPSAGGTGAPAEAAELAELFYAAGATERRLILSNLDYAMVTPAPPACAMQRSDIWRLESAALQHNGEAVVHELERVLGVSRAQVRRIINDELGEPIVVAAKAMELPSDVLQRVLLFMNPHVGQSVDRVNELAELYRDISADAARRLLAIWREAEAADDAKSHHQPMREPAAQSGSQSVSQSVSWRTAAENARRALSEVSRRPELKHEARRRAGGQATI
jgi:hypothetical protein